MLAHRKRWWVTGRGRPMRMTVGFSFLDIWPGIGTETLQRPQRRNHQLWFLQPVKILFSIWRGTTVTIRKEKQKNRCYSTHILKNGYLKALYTGSKYPRKASVP